MGDRMSNATLPHGRMAPGWYLSNLGGMLVYGAIVASPRARHALAGRSGRRFPVAMLAGGFALAAATHVVESAYAVSHARRFELPTRSVAAVGLRTLAVGFPSLIALRAATASEG
jgi:putative copper export protein